MDTAPFVVPEPHESTQEGEPRAGEAARPERKIRAAMDWLRDVMADGEARLASEMEALAEQEGIPKATLTLARQRCHMRSERIQNRWVWKPPRSWKQSATTSARNR